MQRFNASRVLIPSSSGQSFNSSPSLTSPVPIVLIPSSSGQSFNSIRPGLAGFYPVLIPSSSGQSFNLDTVPDERPTIGLNPFFIRSIVQFRRCRPLRRNPVLIPSSSGQSFNSHVRRSQARIPVLIPSSSGQSFN